MWGQSVHAVATQMGLALDRIDVAVQKGVAARDLTIAAGVIPRGTLAATRIMLAGMVDEVPRVTFECNWHVDRDQPNWPETGRVWRIEIEGRPSWRMETKLARTWGDRQAVPDYDALGLPSGALAVSAIPAVCDAPPGIFRTPIFTPYQFPADHSQIENGEF
jgi:hypothetical protein